MTIDELIDKVLIENNSHWLSKAQAEFSISESRMVITRADVHDIIRQLPIRLFGENISVEIDNEGILVIQNKEI